VIVTQISNLNTGDGLFSVKKSHAICLWIYGSDWTTMDF
jgi:hypothetical protein